MFVPHLVFFFFESAGEVGVVAAPIPPTQITDLSGVERTTIFNALFNRAKRLKKCFITRSEALPDNWFASSKQPFVSISKVGDSLDKYDSFTRREEVHLYKFDAYGTLSETEAIVLEIKNLFDSCSLQLNPLLFEGMFYNNELIVEESRESGIWHGIVTFEVNVQRSM